MMGARLSVRFVEQAGYGHVIASTYRPRPFVFTRKRALANCLRRGALSQNAIL